jgi:mRNA-degrading endonuclease RelE of RelBE toxin-antitoxin system
MNNATPLSVDSTSIPKFRRDLDKLAKKYRNIESDLEVATSVITAEPLNPARCCRVEGLKEDCPTPVYILKKFRSTDLRSMNEMRLVYAFIASTNRIIHIEIYFKGEQPSESKERIRKYFSEGSSYKLKL